MSSIDDLQRVLNELGAEVHRGSNEYFDRIVIGGESDRPVWLMRDPRGRWWAYSGEGE